MLDYGPPLPALAGTPAIADGIIVVNGENFGAGATKLTLTKGDLTLNKRMVDGLKTVEMVNGKLTVADGVRIGDGSNGELTLGNAALTGGHLMLNGDMTLAKLTTAAAATNNTIDTNGKTLTVVTLDPANTLNAAVTGNLKLTPAGALNATLKSPVTGKVEVVTVTGAVNATLKVEKNVGEVKFTAADGNTGTGALELDGGWTIGTLAFEKMRTFTAKLNGNNTIDKLNFANVTNGLTVTSLNSDNTIDFLAPAADATLKVAGAAPLSIKRGTSGVNWKAELPANTELALEGKDLLTGTVEMTLKGGTLTLPSGMFLGLDLIVNTADSTIAVDPAGQNPVLKVNKIDVDAGRKLTMKRPTTWWKNLAAGDKVMLLTADTADVGGPNGSVEGGPGDNSVATTEWVGPEKALVLTAKDGFQVPELKGTPMSSGNQCNVLVKVVDGKVDAASWARGLHVVPSGSAMCSTLAAGNEERVLYGVQLSDDFQSGFLRVHAKKAGVANLWGVVDIPLKRGTGGSDDSVDKVGADLSKPTSWSRTAISGDTAVLTSKLRLEGTPKSLKVETSGMKSEPKAELLDAEKVVATSSVPSVSAAKDYTLRLTCKTTQAEIDAGAKIEKVTVTMSDSKTHEIAVNVKLSDMKIGAPGKDGGKKPDGGKTPDGGKNPDGGKTPDGGKEPGGDGGNKKGSSGGGCDAGFGGLALALGAAFLLKRKA